MRTSLSKLTWLLALPVLLFLGLGGRLVMCIVPGGHLVIEAAGSECCEPTGDEEQVAARVVVSTEAGRLSGCDSCSDFEIALPRQASTSLNDGHDPGWMAIQANGLVSAPRVWAHAPLRPPSVAPRLRQLRGTILRC